MHIPLQSGAQMQKENSKNIVSQATWMTARIVQIVAQHGYLFITPIIVTVLATNFLF